MAGIIRAEGRSTRRTLDELSRPHLLSKHRSRPALKRNFEKKRKTANSRGSATGIRSGNQYRIANATHAPDSHSFKSRHRNSNESSTARTSGPTPGPQDHDTPEGICTVLQEAAPQQCQRPASYVHLRRLRGRDVGNVEEEIESPPEKGILLPLVEMPRSRANRNFLRNRIPASAPFLPP